MMAQRERKPKFSEPKRKTYARVLIVGEGKTELTYFNFIKEIYSPIRANIEVFASTNPQPDKILEFTNDKVRESVNNPYSHVFCVFDRDDNLKFNETCQKMENNDYKLARSWPCFEYWLLVHFEQKRPYFYECNECCKRIKDKKYIPHYKKGDMAMLKKFIDKAKIETAIEYSPRSCAEADSTSTDANRTDINNTSTEVYKILECLKELKKTNRLPSA